MKQTAVKWLAQKFEELLVKLDFNEISEDEYLEEWKNIITIAKEMEKQQKDDFAIEFADWIRVCKLKQRPYDFENIEKLLEIYKEEIRL